jgi:hypothetical protein
MTKYIKKKLEEERDNSPLFVHRVTTHNIKNAIILHEKKKKKKKNI